MGDRVGKKFNRCSQEKLYGLEKALWTGLGLLKTALQVGFSNDASYRSKKTLLWQ